MLPATAPVKIYQVGGSVRDELLGLPIADRDYVVVGATPEAMQAAGFRPVGRDFPVFLHPETHAEYALARTERKSGRGHLGFTFHADPAVTLEEDLRRRDLTINAMARAHDGTLVDPYGGRRDLAAGLLRHVSPAFAEDPLRVLRVARFAARFGYAVAAETEALMRDLVEAGELAELSPERVWQEFARGLVAARPSRMFAVLRRCGALAAVAPEFDRLFAEPLAGDQPDRGVATMIALDRGAAGATPPFVAVQFGIACRHLSPEAALAVSERLRAPLDCRDAAVCAARHGTAFGAAAGFSAAQWLDLLQGIDALRRPDRLETLHAVLCAFCATDAGADARPDAGDDARPDGTVAACDRVYAHATQLRAALLRVDYRSLAAGGAEGMVTRVRTARIGALEEALRGGEGH